LFVNDLEADEAIDFEVRSRYYYRTSHGVLGGPFFM